jgi:(p)ppGpp synthase/HD superfamily hydrolase
VSELLLITRAWNFSAQRHATQKRKGEAQEPYVNHLAEVAELVAEATRGQDANLVAAAVLHDTVEDTPTTSAELRTLFNADIADLVVEVTDDKTLDKALRKQLQVEHAASKSRRAKILKLADKTSNLRALANSPPANWDLKRRREYLNWALQVAKGLRGVDPWLEAQFDLAAKRAEATLLQSATKIP